MRFEILRFFEDKPQKNLKFPGEDEVKDFEVFGRPIQISNTFGCDLVTPMQNNYILDYLLSPYTSVWKVRMHYL